LGAGSHTIVRKTQSLSFPLGPSNQQIRGAVLSEIRIKLNELPEAALSPRTMGWQSRANLGFRVAALSPAPRTPLNPRPSSDGIGQIGYASFFEEGLKLTAPSGLKTAPLVSRASCSRRRLVTVSGGGPSTDSAFTTVVRATPAISASSAAEILAYARAARSCPPLIINHSNRGTL